jgi:flagellin-like hook-associated protein FlgL
MRITNMMMVNNAIQNMNDNQEKLSKLQTKVATQKQFQTASENPVNASASLSLRSNMRTLESYSDTAAATSNWMNTSDFALNQLEEIGVQASKLILRGLNDSLSASERFSSLATEMNSLIEKAVEIGNTSVNGQFIFSGYKVNQKAFELVDSPTTILDYQGKTVTPKVVNYLGDQGSMQRNLGPDQSVTMNVRGDQAIQGFIENLISASNALIQNNIHGTSVPPAAPTLQETLTGVKSSADVVNQYRTSNGARMRQVESASNFLETVKIETANLLSQKEDTNMAEGIALLSNQQTTYQAVLEVSQRAISALSLFDYMR